MKTVIVPTDLAVAFLVREGVSETQARNAIYHWSKTGQLTNHGNSQHGQARWDLAEIEALVWPRSPCAGRKSEIP